MKKIKHYLVNYVFIIVALLLSSCVPVSKVTDTIDIPGQSGYQVAEDEQQKVDPASAIKPNPVVNIICEIESNDAVESGQERSCAFRCKTQGRKGVSLSGRLDRRIWKCCTHGTWRHELDNRKDSRKERLGLCC